MQPSEPCQTASGRTPLVFGQLWAEARKKAASWPPFFVPPALTPQTLRAMGSQVAKLGKSMMRAIPSTWSPMNWTIPA